MASSNNSFTLRPLTEPDIDACADIAGLAFETDPQTQFKAADPINPYNHAAGMKGGLRHWLSQSPEAVEMTVAVDNATQETIGWVVWTFRGFRFEQEQDTEQEQRSEQARVGVIKASKLDVESVRGNSPPPNLSQLTAGSVRDRLEQYTSEDLATFMRALMPPGSKCMFISSIVVHPSFQGKGIGSSLIRQGTKRADAEQVCCWVHASDGGAEMFAKSGFHEIRRLELDLDHWNAHSIAPPNNEAKWGTYTFRYMLREPKV